MKSLLFFAILLISLNFQKVSADIVPGVNTIAIKRVSISIYDQVTFINPYTNLQETRIIYRYGAYKFQHDSVGPGIAVCLRLHLYDSLILMDSCYKDTRLEQDLRIRKTIQMGAPTLSMQLVIWHYNDGLDLNTIVDSVQRVRALMMQDSVDHGSFVLHPPQMMIINPGQEPDQFVVNTVNIIGQPYCIYLSSRVSISEGTLSDSIAYADDTICGQSLPVTVSGASNGATIKAIGTPAGYATYGGLIFSCPSGGEVIITQPTTALKSSAQITWGVLPVELFSFTSMVNENNVILNWTTNSETNNSEFQVERKSDGIWETIGYVEGFGTSSASHDYQFIDRNIQSGKYSYRLMQIDFNGNYEYHNLNNEVVIGTPEKFKLKQNYPNPFNPTTRIEYTIPYNGVVNLIVYDINGREISSLVKESKQAGYYSVDFDGSNLSSGIYYYRIIAGNYKVTKRMMLIK